MANQTSVHFQPVKAGSEDHNQRLKVLNYVRQELTPQNEYWESDSQAARLSAIKANYTAHVGRRLHAKATPLREAVVVINGNTTMDDLKRLSQAYKESFGIEVFQIAIHRDEGHHKAKAWKQNLHAHLVVDWTDHQTGKTIKLTRDDMASMQTLTAQILHMDRGVSSDRKHLSAQQYKNQKEEERAADLANQVSDLSKRLPFLDMTIQRKAQLKNENNRLRYAVRRLILAIRNLSPSINAALDAIFGRLKAAQERFTPVQAQTISEALKLGNRRDMAHFLVEVSSAHTSQNLEPIIGKEMQDIADDSSLNLWHQNVQGQDIEIDRPLAPSFEPHFHR